MSQAEGKSMQRPGGRQGLGACRRPVWSGEGQVLGAHRGLPRARLDTALGHFSGPESQRGSEPGVAPPAGNPSGYGSLLWSWPQCSRVHRATGSFPWGKVASPLQAPCGRPATFYSPSHARVP